MYQEILKNIGLSPNEAKIYETLIEQGETTVSKISVAARIHRRNTYDALNRLIDKGLCFQIFSKPETRYNAVNPDKLTELMSEKQNLLAEILPTLKKKFAEHYAPEEAYLYRGYEGQKNIWGLILREGKDCLNIGAKGQWFDPRLEASRITFFKEANRKKMKFYLLFDYEIKVKATTFPKDYPAPAEYRFLPKEYSTNSVVPIFGDYVVMYTGVEIKRMREDTTFFVIHSKDLALSYRKWFWYMWKQSSK